MLLHCCRIHRWIVSSFSPQSAGGAAAYAGEPSITIVMPVFIFVQDPLFDLVLLGKLMILGHFDLLWLEKDPVFHGLSTHFSRWGTCQWESGVCSVIPTVLRYVSFNTTASSSVPRVAQGFPCRISDVSYAAIPRYQPLLLAATGDVWFKGYQCCPATSGKTHHFRRPKRRHPGFVRWFL